MASAHDFTLKTITGQDKKLSDYKGKALLIVNVASHCGYTPQYKSLEELHKKMAPRGLAILGVPCNQFGAQEPGSDQEIATFCEKNYGVTFDMFSKIDVNGPSAHPLYQWLTGETGGNVKWNFAKFLVGKDGSILKRFDSGARPDGTEVLGAIEAALGT